MQTHSQRGVLLVEAILSTVVMAVGLVMISRGLSTHLKALQTLEQYDTMMTLARERLIDLEAEQRAHRIDPLREGVFADPYANYRWTLTNVRIDQREEPQYEEVILTVRRTDKPSSLVQVPAVWPVKWIPEEWH